MSTDDQNAPELADYVEQVLGVEVTPWQRHVLDHIPYERMRMFGRGGRPADREQPPYDNEQELTRWPS